MTHFTTRGEIRGQCPHKHKTRAGAQRCLDADSAGCRQQGGYSDREIVVIDDDGNEWEDLGADPLWDHKRI